MIRMFRKASILYFAICITGIALLSVWGRFSGSLWYLYSVIIISIAWWFSNTYAQKLSGKINNVLLQECNPIEYIAFYEKVLKKKNVKKIRNYILLNLSTGYHSIGNAEECKRALDTIKGFPNTRYGALNTVCFFNNLAGYYMMIKDLENAEDTLNSMKSALGNPKLAKMHYESYYHFYISKNFVLNMAKGNYSGAEEHFSIFFDKEKNLLGKVAAKYYLGKVYIHLGDSEKAVSAFEYVVQNGNLTFYTQKAREYLDHFYSAGYFLNKG